LTLQINISYTVFNIKREKPVAVKSFLDLTLNKHLTTLKLSLNKARCSFVKNGNGYLFFFIAFIYT